MNIAVYCGANAGNNFLYEKATIDLGKWIAERKNTLVYGGGNVGLMKKIADTVLDNGGKVIGIIPTFLQERELAHDKIDEIEVVENMSVRKMRMLELSDVCIALPGGPGTLEEIAEAYSWVRVGQNSSPCIFYNVAGYYDLLKSFFDKMVTEGFLSEVDRSKIYFIDNLNQLDKIIDDYQSPEVRKYK
ncbi:Rossman fold protein, TIGR00730 family [Floricoccus penangensis]|uniref:Cytokinin riboside 5'-monophosphate phosphoribohydrolase n=1 Tax=Floricoccus penangensis TaxID=1859475 RepID=A0A9Q5NZS2_9LACT|nr:TIGR00730 family Rossman fold protein [Floricoccus penangensis]OFI46853.1 Rossman fold protein, TIGR00730 family [Floricoccus penangensis]